MMVLVARAYLEKSSLNAEPKSDQHSVNTKPMKASSRAKSVSVSHSP